MAVPSCWWQEAAAQEIQIPFLSAQCGLVAKILGLFKRLVAEQRMRESSRMALNPSSPSFTSGSRTEIPQPGNFFLLFIPNLIWLVDHRNFCSTQHNPHRTSTYAYHLEHHDDKVVFCLAGKHPRQMWDRTLDAAGEVERRSMWCLSPI